MKHKRADINEDAKLRYELQRKIQYNEKCIEDLLKSVYEIDISITKLLTQVTQLKTYSLA